MCAIFGSYDIDKFKELAELNSYRGQHSYSISAYIPKSKSLTLIDKGFGAFKMPPIGFYETAYWIGHIQAPTSGERTLDTVHPSQEDNSWLWHNGIIKEDFVKEMQGVYGDHSWDTQLLNLWLNDQRSLDEVDGTFSCLRFKDGCLELFRNEISPMFVDGELNISSTKFAKSSKSKANKVLSMNFDDNVLVDGPSFTTKENPYYFVNGV